MQQVWYFISKIQPGLRRSDPLKSSPGSHSLLVSDSVGTTSSCSLLAFHSQSASHHLVYVASASQYLSRSRNCGRLLPVATQSSLAEVDKRSHGNNVRDVIIVLVISADAQINIYTNRRKTQSNLRAQPAGKKFIKVDRSYQINRQPCTLQGWDKGLLWGNIPPDSPRDDLMSSCREVGPLVPPSVHMNYHSSPFFPPHPHFLCLTPFPLSPLPR